MNLPCMQNTSRQGYKCSCQYPVRRIKTNSLKKIKYIGQGLSKFTPVEMVGYEVAEAGSPLALDNG